MTLNEILSSEELRRREFPVAEKKIFFAHAGVCPLPRCVADAVSTYAREATTGDQERFIYPQILNDGREVVAGFLKCQSEGVDFVGLTFVALS